MMYRPATEQSKGTIFNIQRFSLHDGGGIRTIVFLKGCPMRCAWCANPESQTQAVELSVKSMYCIGCKSCEKCCPNGAIHCAVESPHVDRARCTVCGKCEQVCNAGALTLLGYEVTAEEIFQQVMLDKPFFDASNGGITFSGGEPLMQPVFLREALQKFKAANLSTVVETCGFAPRETFEYIYHLVDTFYFDVKLMDSERHKKYTGVSNQLILSNLKYLREVGARVFVRMPLIPGVNDSEENLLSTGEYLKKIDVHEMQLLPYHSFGASKYPTIGRTYTFCSRTPTGEEMEYAKNILVGCGVKVKI